MSKNEIDMSLRLRSDHVPLRPLVEQLDVPITHEHLPGHPMAKQGPLKERLARRYYVLAAELRTENDADVTTWCRAVMTKIAANKSLVDLLASGEIEGTVWIALLGDEPSPMPDIATDIVDAAVRLKLSLFLENYTIFDEEGVPQKTWLNLVGTGRGGL